MEKTTRQILRENIAKAVGDTKFDILIPPDSKLGDYSTNAAFRVAKNKEKPVDAAGVLKNLIIQDLDSMFDVQIAPNGFINFYARPKFLQHQLGEIYKDSNYGQSEEGTGKKVIVEYSSPNIAKPMHIGHLRSTIIGDSLANVYDKLGYETIRWNYIGDWGTQFGLLVLALKEYLTKGGDIEVIKEDPINEINKLYIEIHKQIEISKKEIQGDPLLSDGITRKDFDVYEKARQEFVKLEHGDKENRKIWEEFRNISLAYFATVYAQLGMDIWHGKFKIKGESDYESQLKPLIEELQKKGLAKESEGALIIELGDMPPMMLRKTDGATLYATRDIASLEDRIENYHPDKILYVVANQQALHFEQLFAVAKKLGWTESELVHVKFGMVLGEDGKKLATREGKVVPLQEVIDKVTDMARETVKQKNSNLSSEEMERVAHVVAIGALKYNDLKQHPYSDIEFDWKAMLDLSGNSGPYVQYTYSRLASILRKAGNLQPTTNDLQFLDELSELRLMRQLLDYPEAIKECAERYALNGLALYLYDLAHLANQFYEQVHVLEDENTPRRDARLLLIKTVARTLKDGLALLGIETLERI